MQILSHYLAANKSFILSIAAAMLMLAAYLDIGDKFLINGGLLLIPLLALAALFWSGDYKNTKPGAATAIKILTAFTLLFFFGGIAAMPYRIKQAKLLSEQTRIDYLKNIDWERNK
ncbi:MAG: hypothetical protein PHD76_11925 [Methylacidiphilales bacterium]|nr:hypothetical protein [Candidatus Methylacidiphilales bacterium]